MKTKLLTMFLAVGMLSGCSSAFFLSSSGTGADDVYYNPNKDYSVTNAQPEINPVNSSDPRIAELQKKMNTSMAAAVADTTVASDTTNVEQKDENPYNSILASSYQDAQRRRDEAQADPSMNYSDLQDALFYASAYDPAFYNVIIYGSHVWVEPKYMSTGWYYPDPRFSFYGGFGYPYYSSSVYLGWGYSPFDYGFYPFTFGLGLSYNPYYSWNSWGYGYYPYSYYDNDRINQRPYYYGRRSSGPSTFSSPTMLRRSTSNSMLRTTTVSPLQTTVRRPSTTTERYSSNRPAYSRKPVGNTSTPYTRPATATGRRTVNPNTNTYTPTYTRPSNGLRQNYNNNRPTTTTPANNYYRRPASSSNSSTPEYPRRNENRGTFSQPTSSGSFGHSNSNSNSGSGNAGSRRRR